MPDFPPPRVVWTGQLTDNGPVMNVVEDRWGQHLEPTPPMLADSPPQTDLTMLAYHEVGPYPCPSDEELEDEYD
jgi:hypothetical protein